LNHSQRDPQILKLRRTHRGARRAIVASSREPRSWILILELDESRDTREQTRVGICELTGKSRSTLVSTPALSAQAPSFVSYYAHGASGQGPRPACIRLTRYQHGARKVTANRDRATANVPRPDTRGTAPPPRPCANLSSQPLSLVALACTRRRRRSRAFSVLASRFSPFRRFSRRAAKCTLYTLASARAE